MPVNLAQEVSSTRRVANAPRKLRAPKQVQSRRPTLTHVVPDICRLALSNPNARKAEAKDRTTATRNAIQASTSPPLQHHYQETEMQGLPDVLERHFLSCKSANNSKTTALLSTSPSLIQPHTTTKLN